MLLDPPTTTEELRLLRSAVAAHAGQERRRTFPALVHAGRPGGPEAVFGHLRSDRPLDHALRTDVVEALLRRCGPAVPLVWLTRPGDLGLHDEDLAWAAACRSARAETGRPRRFVVVTRHGWHDPSTGAARTWRRLRT